MNTLLPPDSRFIAPILGFLLAVGFAGAADWQYRVDFESAKKGKETEEPAGVYLWLPPDAETVRGLLIGGRLRIEEDIALDPGVRKVCEQAKLGIVYFSPHISGTFNFWKEGNTDKERLLKALDDLAARSGHAEIRRVPWITMGHSTAGIFCRNVAYAFPGRVAGVVHVKSGNFHQAQHLPPEGSLVGVPLVAMNGQLETFGPEGGIRPALGRETQWQVVRENLQQFREKDSNYLVSAWLDLGGDHFLGAKELTDYAALFLAKTAQYRIPAELPPGDAPVLCLPLKAEDGWLTDYDLHHPTHAPAPYADYTGDKAKAMWHYDGEIAKANAAHHRNAAKHQVIDGSNPAWLDEGDGWTLRAHGEFLETMPEKFGGSLANAQVGHAKGDIIYRSLPTQPVEQIGPDTFRLLRPVDKVEIAAVSLGDDDYRATNRWSSLEMPKVKGEKQTIDFPPVPDVAAESKGVELKATATSGLPVYYEVIYGPVAVKDGKLTISELPRKAKLPIECLVKAYQIGRRVEPAIPAAEPVARTFQIIEP